MPSFRLAISDSSSRDSRSLQARIADYRRVLEDNVLEHGTAQDAASHSRWRALWICASQHTVSYLQAHLAAGRGEPSKAQLSPGALLSPGIGTFAQLAEALLVQADQRILPLSSLERRWVLGQLAKQALAEKKLVYFAPIAASTGFATQVEGLIVDLKRRDIWPEQFTKAARSVRERELGLLYARYQEHLIEHNLYDAEGRFWAAREALTNNANLATGLQLIHVDGFGDFTTAQHDILKLLTARCDSTHISLPLDSAASVQSPGDQSSRNDLFAKPLRTLALLRANLGQPEVDGTDHQTQNNTWETREHLLTNLFRDYAAVKPPSKQAIAGLRHIEIVAASSEQQEVEAIATRVKRLLQTGVLPADIVVCFRSLGDVSDRLRSVFADFSIPVQLETRRSLATAPAVRRLVLLLSLHTQDWAYRDLLRVIGDSGIVLTPQAVDKGADTFPKLRRTLERLIRSAQLPRGKRALLEQLSAWAKHEQAEEIAAGIVEPESSPTEQAVAVLRSLAELLETLPNRATPEQWIESCEALAQALGILQGKSGEDRAQSDWETLVAGLERLGNSWRRFDLLNAKVVKPEATKPADSTGWSLADFLSAVQYVASQSQRQETSSGDSGVLTTSAENVRHLHPRHLFLGGLGERSFPAPGQSDSLLSVGELDRLAASGRATSNAEQQHSSDEMLLFYQLVTRPAESLTLSYPALDAKAQPLEPSPYLADLRRAFGESEVPTTTLPLGSLADGEDATAPLSRSGGRRHAVSALLEGKPRPLVQLSGTSRGKRCGESILAALEMINSRSRREQFGMWEGLYTSDASKRQFAEQFGAQHFWSPSQLESYAACGFRFAGEHALKLEPLPELTLETDVRHRGSLLHEALATVHEQMLNAPSETLRVEIVERFIEVLEQIAASQQIYGLPGALREIQRRELANWGENLAGQTDNYQRMWNDFDVPPRPTHFEVRFGPGSRHADEQLESQLSSSEAYELVIPTAAGGSETIRFTGQIDRLDVGRIEGQEVFNVIDYKSSKSQKVDLSKLSAGTQLQLPIYALAAEELLMRESKALAWEAGYWSVQGAGFGKATAKGKHTPQLKMREEVDGNLEVTATWLQAKSQLVERITELIAGIRQADFPVFNDNKDCTKFCSLSTICRIAQIRSLDKQWPPPEESKIEETASTEGSGDAR
ncbi:PD-(D/E)XK nuclease family protein [Adhaeretor mobilis]|uniref:ATP-dependent helicase/deoxyribonuclease subunit B n=1 Tax=Adhaeretor mobilis TaxID=1930276 RepID=A0A517MU31_9BACT|nr:PD-(D/E)XK nuclease family protein [Adhaeretor mobilis]QDS98389.1 ATP-dependent helicase/deoxyribonuclease subunit B [Adhaeretor mobilis]